MCGILKIEMSESCQEILDPRIRRTRQLLHEALAKLLEKKEFEKISVQDIAEASTVNRATFYDHYADKFALLQCMVGARFQEFLSVRHVQFDGACSAALKTLVGVCVTIWPARLAWRVNGSGPCSRTWKPR